MAVMSWGASSPDTLLITDPTPYTYPTPIDMRSRYSTRGVVLRRTRYRFCSFTAPYMRQGWDEHFLDFFADKGYRALPLSLRGHGRSPPSRTAVHSGNLKVLQREPRATPMVEL